MKKTLIFLAVCFILCFTPSASAIVGGSTVHAVIRAGYCEGESYYEFNYSLNNLIHGLEEYGLIGPLPEGMPVNRDSRDIWNWISSLDQRGWSVNFIKDAFFSLTDEQYADISPLEVSTRMSQIISGYKVNLMLAMGTAGSLKVKSLYNKTPVMCFSTADAVKSGIVEEAAFSKTPDVWAQTDADAFKRSISVMNDIFAPKKLGVVYEDTKDAYIYSGIDVLEEFCAESGIELLHGYVNDPKTESDYPEYLENLSKAYERLSRDADVFILTTSLVKKEDYEALFEPFYRESTPVYSINSTEDVQFGALMAAESSDYRNTGRFGADTIRRFLSGEKLEDLPQMYQTAPYLVINYQTARKIGYKPSFNVLLSASQIYCSDDNLAGRDRYGQSKNNGKEKCI